MESSSISREVGTHPVRQPPITSGSRSDSTLDHACFVGSPVAVPYPPEPKPATGFLRTVAQTRPYLSRSPWDRRAYRVWQRSLDVLVSLTVLLLLFPVLLTVAVLIGLTSRGPILFKHRRLGLGGREFWCFKLRTMYADAEERLRRDTRLREQFEATYKIKDDPRVTPLGAFLRKTSIDELPQLLNVLRGEMTLIGPRPIVAAELSRYGDHQEEFLTVKPGLGGLWQVCGRSETTYEERVVMDLTYVRHRSARVDLLLMLLTAVAVCKRSGAC